MGGFSISEAFLKSAEILTMTVTEQVSVLIVNKFVKQIQTRLRPSCSPRPSVLLLAILFLAREHSN